MKNTRFWRARGIVAPLVAGAALVACAWFAAALTSQQPSYAFAQQGAEAATLAKDGADPTSIVAVEAHPDGLFTEESVGHNATCAACHDSASLVEAGEGILVDPDSGTLANPHSNHQYLDCVDCHSPVGQSVMYCNSCHEFALAEGWANPELGASEIGFEFDSSGMGYTYEECGRSQEKLPAEVTDGFAQLEAMAQAAGTTAEELKVQILQQMLGGM